MSEKEKVVTDVIQILDEVKIRLKQSANLISDEGISLHFTDYNKVLHILVSHHKNLKVINIVVEKKNEQTNVR